jgi:hypothetical protein
MKYGYNRSCENIFAVLGSDSVKLFLLPRYQLEMLLSKTAEAKTLKVSDNLGLQRWIGIKPVDELPEANRVQSLGLTCLSLGHNSSLDFAVELDFSHFTSFTVAGPAGRAVD